MLSLSWPCTVAKKCASFAAKCCHAAPQDESSLHVEQLVQVLGALASLGCAQQVQNGSALLVIVLQRIYEGLSALQPRYGEGGPKVAALRVGVFAVDGVKAFCSTARILAMVDSTHLLRMWPKSFPAATHYYCPHPAGMSSYHTLVNV